MMAAGEDAEVAGHVEAGRRNEGAQPGQELVSGHVGVGSTAAPGGFEVNAHAAVREGLHGIVGERRAEQVAADSFELLAVATVDGRRGVQVHAERRYGEGRRGGGCWRRDQVRAGEPELHAGPQRRVHVQVVVLIDGGEGLVDMREHGRHARRRRRRRGAGALARAVMHDMRWSVKERHGLGSVEPLHAGVCRKRTAPPSSSKAPSVARACRCTNRPRSPRNLCTTVRSR